VEILETAEPEVDLEVIFGRLGRSLRTTRGVALTLLERRGGVLRAAGVGNVALRLWGAASLPFLNTPGIVGSTTRRLRVAEAPLTGPTRALLHSDGISTSFELRALQHLPAPELVSTLMHSHAAAHDDATVLVVDFGVHDARQ
jgi:hypothetical protein